MRPHEEDDVRYIELIPDRRENFVLYGCRNMGKIFDVGIVFNLDASGTETPVGLFLDDPDDGDDDDLLSGQQYRLPNGVQTWMADENELWMAILAITNMYSKKPNLEDFFEGLGWLMIFMDQHSSPIACPAPLRPLYKPQNTDRMKEDTARILLELTKLMGNYETAFPHRYYVIGGTLDFPIHTDSLDEAVEHKLRSSALIIDLRAE